MDFIVYEDKLKGTAGFPTVSASTSSPKTLYHAPMGLVYVNVGKRLDADSSAWIKQRLFGLLRIKERPTHLKAAIYSGKSCVAEGEIGRSDLQARWIGTAFLLFSGLSSHCGSPFPGFSLLVLAAAPYLEGVQNNRRYSPCKHARHSTSASVKVPLLPSDRRTQNSTPKAGQLVGKVYKLSKLARFVIKPPAPLRSLPGR